MKQTSSPQRISITKRYSYLEIYKKNAQINGVNDLMDKEQLNNSK